MGGAEGGEEIEPETDQLAGRQPPPFETPGQRLAREVVHGVVEEPVGLAGVVDPNHVGVSQAGGVAGLAEEALGRGGGRQLRLQHLDGDGTVEQGIASEEDEAHAATRDLALHGDTGSERSTQAVQHRGRRQGVGSVPICRIEVV